MYLWQSNTSINKGDYIRISSSQDIVFRAIETGITSSSEPAWNTTVGSITIDNTVSWLCLDSVIYDYLYSKGLDFILDCNLSLYLVSEIPLHYAEAIYTNVWSSLTSYNSGDVIFPTTWNGFAYLCVQSGISGGSEPSWSVVEGDEIIDDTCKWKAVKSLFIAKKDISLSDKTKELNVYGSESLKINAQTGINISHSGTVRFITLVCDNKNLVFTVKLSTPLVVNESDVIDLEDVVLNLKQGNI